MLLLAHRGTRHVNSDVPSADDYDLLADPTFRSQLEGYASFENGQALDRSITFDSARVVSQTATTAMLEVRTTSVRADGTQHCGGTIQLERSGSAWLLHQIGINCT